MRSQTLFAALALFLLFSGCDNAGDEPGTGTSPGLSLVGTYTLVSLQDVTGEVTTIPNRVLLAGVPNPITIPSGPDQGVLVTFVITGELTLTGQSYTADITINSSANGQSSTSQDSEAGSYVVDGTTMTLNPDFDNEDSVISWTLVQNRLTLSDSETILVYQKR